MSATGIASAPAVERQALAVLAGTIADDLGIEVSFHDPDGAVLVGPADRYDESLLRLTRKAAETGRDAAEPTDGGLLAAWPIRRRTRTVLVAAARLPADGARAGRLLVASVGESIRARVALTQAHSETHALSAALSQSFEEVSLLHGLGEVLCVTQPVGELLQRACQELRACLAAEAVGAYLPAVEGMPGTTVVAGTLPMASSSLPPLVQHVNDGLGAEHSLIINNHCQDDPDLAGLSIAIERLVLVPLPLREGVNGAMVAVNRREAEFGSPDAKLVRSVAGSCAIFVENHRLYQDLQQLMLDLVRALVSSIDAKDPYTCGHSERVAITCREVARRMSLPDDQVEAIYLAGLLHDIGKIGTPEHILLKTGKLDPEERRIINQHPVVGARILSGVKRLQHIREAVLYHHERLDGSGYPESLRGDGIPTFARIVGLADAFDAMTSNRPYRPMLPLEYVVREIERNVGRQFDVQVVDALFAIGPARLIQQFVDRPSSVCAELIHP